MKKLFRDIHLWLSLPLGILITIVCLSGASLVFEQDITQALQRPLYTVTPPAEGAQPLSPSQLVAHIRIQAGDSLHLTSLQLSGNPEEAAFASFRETGKKQLSIDPYTGKVLGWTQSYPFFQTMRKLHRWLMNPPASKGEKSIGKVVVGITTLAMVFILISGLVIWVPRTRKALKNRLQVSFTKGWRRFWYDSHVAIGFYCTLFLLVMALTGLTWSFGWYRTAAYSLFGAETQSPARTSSPTKEEKPEGKKQRAFDYAVWDQVASNLQAHYPVYKTLTLSERNVQIIPNPNAIMHKADVVTFDARTGDIKEISPYDERPRAQTMRGWFYAFHTGSWGGMITKILYFLAALFGGILPLSGYYLWWKRTHRRN